MAGTRRLENAGPDCLGSDSGPCSLAPKQDIIAWFGNPDWGLGLPFPELMTYLASCTEYFGAILLLIGLAVGWRSLPLMFTMIVAAIIVHWQNGWLTEHGSFVVLNNGIEFFATFSSCCGAVLHGRRQLCQPRWLGRPPLAPQRCKLMPAQRRPYRPPLLLNQKEFYGTHSRPAQVVTLPCSPWTDA